MEMILFNTDSLKTINSNHKVVNPQNRLKCYALKPNGACLFCTFSGIHCTGTSHFKHIIPVQNFIIKRI